MSAAVSPGERVDLSSRRRIHVVGVGGVGMSALATALAGMGHQVTGSDLRDSAALDRLRAVDVELHLGHRKDNLAGAEVVTVSSAVPDDNPEVVAARSAGTPVVSRAQMLGSLSDARRTVAVAGTHGKTTTASMLALVLGDAGMRPSYVIGGEPNESGTGAAWDEGDWLIVEADESDGSFLELSAELAVVTNVEPDHLEHYGGSFATLEAAFSRFLGAASGPRLACADDPVAARLAAACGAVTFGRSEGADYRIVGLESGRSTSSFALLEGGRSVCHVGLSVPGAFNALNAGAAIVAGILVGVAPEIGLSALSRFTGVARRFQFRGTRRGVTFVDDYAHLPSEAAAALAAAAEGGWSRVVSVFQPHRYSRTATLWEDFADAFVDADVLVVCDVYPAGEQPRPGVSGELVAGAVRRAHPGAEVLYMATRSQILAELPELLREGDLCLTLGAGDLTSLPDELMAEPRW